MLSPAENRQLLARDITHAEHAICYQPSVRPSVHPSIRHMGGSVKNSWI